MNPAKEHKAFVFSDIVDSTGRKRRMGELEYVELKARHDALFSECLSVFSGQLEADRGDGFFALFDLPSNAVQFALAFQTRIPHLEVTEPLEIRIAIHTGEMYVVGPTGRKAGIAIDTAARLSDLAQGRQILLTRGIFDTVRQTLRAASDGPTIKWLAHGRYLFKGLDDEPIEVYEVGIEGISHLSAPPNSAKATRAITPLEEETLGWRPAVGLSVPNRVDWCLQKKLADGGFGETWLAQNPSIGLERVFKFCFKPERLKSLKREAHIFRSIDRQIRDAPNIARVLDCQFEKPPYFLVSEYAEGGSLIDWSEQKGGVECVELPTRLEIVAQAAEALGIAHAAGVLHRDIKPSNILIAVGPGGMPQVRLADFGLGLIKFDEMDKRLGSATASQSQSTQLDSSDAGSRRYMAPELLEGRPPSVRTDIFALGVVLFQAVIGDFDRALGFDWDNLIQDDFLREDIAACVVTEPSNVILNASELAQRLRTVEDRARARRAAQEGEARARLAAEQRAKQVRKTAVRQRRRERREHYASIALLVGSVFGVLFALMEIREWRQAVKSAEGVFRNNVLAANLAAAHWIATAVERELRAAESIVGLMAADQRLRESLRCGDGKGLQLWVDDTRTLRAPSALFSWFIADKEGVIRARSPWDPTVIGKSCDHRDWFNGGDPDHRVLRAAHISEPYVSMASEEQPMIAVSTPIWPLEGAPYESEPVGVLAATLTLYDLTNWLQHVPRLDSSETSSSDADPVIEIVLLNDRGQVVHHSKNPLLDSCDVYTWPNGEALFPDAWGVHDAFWDDLNQRNYVAAYCKISNYRWVVCVEQGRERVWRPFTDVAHVHEFGWIAVSFAVLVTTLLFARFVRIASTESRSATTAK